MNADTLLSEVETFIWLRVLENTPFLKLDTRTFGLVVVKSKRRAVLETRAARHTRQGRVATSSITTLGRSRQSDASGFRFWWNMGNDVRLDRPFDVVDAAIDRHLKVLCREKGLRYDRYTPTPSSAEYALLYMHPPTISLRSSGGGTCTLTIDDPQQSDIDTMTPEQLADRPMRNSDGSPIVYNEQQRLSVIASYRTAQANRQAYMENYRAAIRALEEALKREGLLTAAATDAGDVADKTLESIVREMWNTDRRVLIVPIKTLVTALLEQRHTTGLRAEIASETITVVSCNLRRGNDIQAEIVLSSVDASQTKMKFIPSRPEITPDSSDGRSLIEFLAGALWNANDSHRRARETLQSKPGGADGGPQGTQADTSEGIITRDLPVLNCNVPTFITWLGWYTSDLVLRKFPSDRGYFRIDPLPSPWPTTPPIAELTFIELTGRRGFDGETGSNPQEIDHWRWLIRFDIVRLGKNRIRLRAQCSESAVMNYFGELLKAIKSIYSIEGNDFDPVEAQRRARERLAAAQAQRGEGYATVFDEDCEATRDDVYGVVERFVLRYSASQRDVFRWHVRRELGELRIDTNGLPVVVVEADRINDNASHVLVACLGRDPDDPFHDYSQALSLSEAIRDELTRHYLRTGLENGRAATVNKSGGFDIHANTLNIYGDVVGRDKISSAANGRQAFDMPPDSKRHSEATTDGLIPIVVGMPRTYSAVSHPKDDFLLVRLPLVFVNKGATVVVVDNLRLTLEQNGRLSPVLHFNQTVSELDAAQEGHWARQFPIEAGGTVSLICEFFRKPRNGFVFLLGDCMAVLEGKFNGDTTWRVVNRFKLRTPEAYLQTLNSNGRLIPYDNDPDRED